MNKLKKVLTWTGVGLGGILGLGLTFLFCIVSSKGLIYSKFYEKGGDTSIRIPGLDTTFCPQGLGHDDVGKHYLVSGYMVNGDASRLYISNESGSEWSYVELYKNETTINTSHLGGVSCHGDYIYLANSEDASKNVFVVERQDVFDAINKDKKIFPEEATMDVYNNSSFTFTNDYYLWDGEFYYMPSYPTDESHHFTVSSTGEKLYALTVAFEMGPNGLASTTPSYALAIRDRVQGFAVTGSNKIVLSTSYSIFSSTLSIYDNPVDGSPDDQITLGSVSVPVYFLSNAYLTSTYDIPPMSEGLDYVDGKVIINFESASSKFKSVNLLATTHLNAISIA